MSHDATASVTFHCVNVPFQDLLFFINQHREQGLQMDFWVAFPAVCEQLEHAINDGILSVPSEQVGENIAERCLRLCREQIEEVAPSWRVVRDTWVENHIFRALVCLISTPEYQSLSARDQNLCLWAMLLHDISKVAARDPVHPFHSAATAAKVLFSWLHRPRMHNDHATVTHCLPQAPVLLTPIADAPHSAPSPLLPPLHPASTMSAFEPAKCQTNTSAAPPLLSTASSSTVSSSEPLAAPQQNLGPAPLPPCSSAASSSTASADPSFRSWRTYRQPSFSCPMISPGCYCTCQDHNHSVTALCEFVREFGPTGHFIDYQRWMPNNESLPQIMDSVNGIFAHGPGGCSSSVTPSPGCDDSAWRSFSHIDETEFDVHHYRSHLERAHADGPPRCLAEQYRQKSFNFKSASSDAKHTSNSVPPEKSTLDCVRFISACEEVCLSYSDAREIVLVVLLHQSLPGIDEYPPLAPLPQHLIASHITSRLLQLLLPCMLADSASYTMASAFDTQRYATNIRKSVDKLLQTIEKAGQ